MNLAKLDILKSYHFLLFFISIFFLNVGISLSYSVIFILFFILFFLEKKSTFFFKENNLFLFFLAFFILLSFFLLKNDFVDIKKYIKQLLYLKFYLLSFYIFFVFRESFHILKIFKFIFYLITLLIIDIYLQRFFNLEILGNEIFYERASGPYKQLIAGTLILFVGFHGFLIFLLNIDLIKNKIVGNLNFILLFIFYFFSIFVTGERMNFLLSLMAIFLMFILIPQKRVQIFFSFIVLILIISLSIIYNQSLNKKYNNLLKLINISKVVVEESQISNEERKLKKIKNLNSDKITNFHFVLWINSYELFKKKPFFGNGLGSYRYVCSKNDELNYFIKEGRCNTHPHNIYAEILVELGILGLAFLCFYFYKSINFFNIKSFFSRERGIYNEKESLFLSLLIIFILLLWPFKITGRLFSNFYGTIFWLNIFCFFAYNKFLLKKIRE